MKVKKTFLSLMSRLAKKVATFCNPRKRKNSLVNHYANIPDKFFKKYKFLLYPRKDCKFCRGAGYELDDRTDVESNYNYHDVCRCMKRHKDFQNRIIDEVVEFS